MRRLAGVRKTITKAAIIGINNPPQLTTVPAVSNAAIRSSASAALTIQPRCRYPSSKVISLTTRYRGKTNCAQLTVRRTEITPPCMRLLVPAAENKKSGTCSGRGRIQAIECCIEDDISTSPQTPSVSRRCFAPILSEPTRCRVLGLW